LRTLYVFIWNKRKDVMNANDCLLLTASFRRSGPNCSPVLARYFAHLVPSLEAWTKALKTSG